MKTKSNAGLKVKSGIKAAGFGTANHARCGMRVKAGVKAGVGLMANHNAGLLCVG